MSCEYLRKLCKAGCDNYSCRAFFPEKQPMVAKRDLPMCQSDEHAECLQWSAGRAYHEERRKKNLDLHCAFASNTRCGKPWHWMCKGGVPPFELTIPVLGAHNLPKRNPDGSIMLTQGVKDLLDSCFSGKAEVYEGCPHFQRGVKFRSLVNAKKSEALKPSL